jgi:hypothetical protein
MHQRNSSLHFSDCIDSRGLRKPDFYCNDKTIEQLSIKSYMKCKSENGLTQTSECIRGGIRCHGLWISPFNWTEQCFWLRFFLFTCLGVLIWLIDWLFIVLYPPQVWRRHHCWGKVAKFRPMLVAQGLWGIFIVPQVLWHGASVFPVTFGLPHSVASYETQGDVENLI